MIMTGSNRRVLARLAVVVLLALHGQTVAAEPAGDLTGRWQLFVDDHLVAARNHVARTYHAFEKYAGNPVLVPDRPWEHNVVACGTVLPDEAGAGYRESHDVLPYHKELPSGGAPVRLRFVFSRASLFAFFGEDAELGSDQQFRGHIDDLLVLGRALAADEIESLHAGGAEKLIRAGALAGPERGTRP